MHFVADFHLHSKYSRAVSKNMILPEMVKWAHKKGIDALTVADWTHPLWFKEIKNQLQEASAGMYALKDAFALDDPLKDKGLRFIFSTEISSIYSQGGKTRRIHNLVFASSMEVAEKINIELVKRGANLGSDGRPIIGLSARDLLSLVLEVDEHSFIIPCHVWTPWFSVYGSKSGFDSLDECFGDLSKYIYGIETGLSSDPSMNWEIPELSNRSILSFSDSHSLIKMGREATVFDFTKNLKDVAFSDIKSAIMRKKEVGKIAYTIEFYPEEGKYHYTGHRNCKVMYTPEDTKKNGTICPVCKRGLTVGVMERVNDLSVKRNPNIIEKPNDKSLTWIMDPTGKHPPYVNLVPLIEIVAESMHVQVGSQRVQDLYDTLCLTFGSELNVLLKTDINEVKRIGGEKLSEALFKVRCRDIAISPGFDGEFGKVKIWNENKDQKETVKSQIGFNF